MTNTWLNIQPGFKAFSALARKGNTIPVFAEILGDLETPVSSFLKLCPDGEAFLLESVEQGRTQARYSFLGYDPGQVVVREKGVSRAFSGARESASAKDGDPIDFLKRAFCRYRYAASGDFPVFAGGAVGYLSYDVARHFERLPKPAGPEEMPELYFQIAGKTVIFDHFNKTMRLVVNAGVPDGCGRAGLRQIYARASKEVAEMYRRLRVLSPKRAAPAGSRKFYKGGLASNFSKPGFMRSVKRLKDDIRRGEAIQIVLSQKFNRPLKVQPFDVYRALRTVNPSPYMFYLKGRGFELVGSSPETHVRVDKGRVYLKPIAGTRPRGADRAADERFAKELLKDPKERSEHVMLVDLGRNDLGRVCETGSVQVSDFMTIERYSHVMHIVSQVSGKLAPGRDVFDVIRSTFPAGTVSGAPKVRAMELIAREEADRRGPYAGLVGYLSFSGGFDSCITIRTLVVRKGLATVQAGAGIVIDSDPASEYQETRNKARAVWKAVELAERGLV